MSGHLGRPLQRVFPDALVVRATHCVNDSVRSRPRLRTTLIRGRDPEHGPRASLTRPDTKEHSAAQRLIAWLESRRKAGRVAHGAPRALATALRVVGSCEKIEAGKELNNAVVAVLSRNIAKEADQR
eukprot:CAMPEP_0202040196 /NCGR_PEP_ID=MMETSP0962-20130828/19637_1 /ASSEMBLY_ACC=CAM_ASM_000488 /TAXON_ID=4773 /ORGANISM="Schizochytrium aggregatum, Strain ATCC28209" /LENGTH=126 /DNA_ID=CAMNT_0048604457 /DNA_START=143 /DNA_END=520 /DNA_ORIENTATION=-